jgi:alpha,alpha-trehalose phosphorylase
VIAAEVGHLDLAYDYFGEAARIDLHDLEHNTHDGLHIASLAGAWLAAVAGFGGMRDHDGNLTFAPRLPPRLERLTFRIHFRGRRLKVEFDRNEVTYTLLDGPPLSITHHGDSVEIPADATLTKPIPAAPVRATPTQPTGREPAKRESYSETRRA